MASRPSAAQPQAPSSLPGAKAGAAIPPALAALRGAPGGGTPKNFGPPTLQSDTVVFQAAKIPPSSARHASAPGTAGLAPSVRTGGAYSSAREIDAARRGGAYGPPGAIPGRAPYDRPPSPPRRHPPVEAGYHGGGHMHGAPDMMPPQRRPRSPPQPGSRDRASVDIPRGHPGMDGLTPPRGMPPNQRDSKEFTHLMEDAAIAQRTSAPPADPVGGTQRAPKRQARPSSAESKASNGGRSGVIQLTVRVMKDGEKLGFGIRNDSNRKLKVSTLQTNSTAAKSTLKIGDTILSVNGIDLTGMGFLEVIQQLKATKPGELVFDIERSLDEDDTLSGAEGSQQGETMDLDSPLSVAEKRFGPSATRSSPGPGVTQLPQQQRRPERSDMLQAAQPATATPPPPPSQQRGLGAPRERLPMNGPSSAAVGRDVMVPQYAQGVEGYAAGGVPEPPRKRPRPASMTPAQVDMELARMDKQHRAVLGALTLELKKERTEKLNLEEKNTALRKRLQNMLIECDEVRVKAGSTVASIKEHAQRDIHELKQALQAARAQLRLQDRGPDVGRTDSIVNELLSTKEQLNRLRKIEMERATNLSNRYNLESRQAEREASRTRDQLITLFTTQLREIARRNYNNSGVRTGKDSGSSNVVVQMEGLRRLAFVKMFGLPCSYEWYTSDDFYSTTLVRHSLPKQENVMDIFGNRLCHEERAGLFLVAIAPMNVAYDPTTEKLTLSCSWIEQNQVRELARNFRF